MRARLILNVDHEMQRTPDKQQLIVSGDKRAQYLKQAGFFYFLNLNDISSLCDSSISRREGFTKSVYRLQVTMSVYRDFTHFATSIF